MLFFEIAPLVEKSIIDIVCINIIIYCYDFQKASSAAILYSALIIMFNRNIPNDYSKILSSPTPWEAKRHIDKLL